ncbi:hypothetical protein [Streptomyces sp. NPDC056291]|uniref:hypothetical protein n=1 Tax=Streptomyces sp. NPDC056291 TaxID=3345772 RepID=UPI0035E0E990
MKVRTTMRPHEEIDVTDAEYLDLKRQGLLLPELPNIEPAKSYVRAPKKEN